MTVLLTGRVMSTRNFSVGGIAGIHVIVSASVFRRPLCLDCWTFVFLLDVCLFDLIGLWLPHLWSLFLLIGLWLPHLWSLSLRA